MQQDNYHLRTVTTGGEQKFYASFTDGSGIRQETEITREIHMVLDACRKHEQRIIRSGERHIERSLLSDEQLFERAVEPPAPMEETIAQTVDMQAALATLTEIQRQRFLLHYERRLSYEQIAVAEGCSVRAVKYSVTSAKASLKKYFEG